MDLDPHESHNPWPRRASSPDEMSLLVQQELSNLKALKRLSIGASGTAAQDPDLPDLDIGDIGAVVSGGSQMGGSLDPDLVDSGSPVRLARHASITKQRSIKRERSNLSMRRKRSESSEYTAEDRAPKPESSVNVNSEQDMANIWVPAGLHPELAPNEWQAFVNEKMAEIRNSHEAQQQSRLSRNSSRLSRVVAAPEEYVDAAVILDRRRRSSASDKRKSILELSKDFFDGTMPSASDAMPSFYSSQPDFGSDPDDSPVTQVSFGQAPGATSLRRSTHRLHKPALRSSHSTREKETPPPSSPSKPAASVVDPASASAAAPAKSAEKSSPPVPPQHASYRRKSHGRMRPPLSVSIVAAKAMAHTAEQPPSPSAATPSPTASVMLGYRRRKPGNVAPAAASGQGDGDNALSPSHLPSQSHLPSHSRAANTPRTASPTEASSSSPSSSDSSSDEVPQRDPSRPPIAPQHGTRRVGEPQSASPPGENPDQIRGSQWQDVRRRLDFENAKPANPPSGTNIPVQNEPRESKHVRGDGRRSQHLRNLSKELPKEPSRDVPREHDVHHARDHMKGFPGHALDKELPKEPTRERQLPREPRGVNKELPQEPVHVSREYTADMQKEHAGGRGRQAKLENIHAPENVSSAREEDMEQATANNAGSALATPSVEADEKPGKAFMEDTEPRGSLGRLKEEPVADTVRESGAEPREPREPREPLRLSRNMQEERYREQPKATSPKDGSKGDRRWRWLDTQKAKERSPVDEQKDTKKSFANLFKKRDGKRREKEPERQDAASYAGSRSAETRGNHSRTPSSPNKRFSEANGYGSSHHGGHGAARGGTPRPGSPGDAKSPGNRVDRDHSSNSSPPGTPQPRGKDHPGADAPTPPAHSSVAEKRRRGHVRVDSRISNDAAVPSDDSESSPDLANTADIKLPYDIPAHQVSDRSHVMMHHRFPLHIERAIYRLSHMKLANPRRPLRQQVLLSNFMYAYLNVVNKSFQQQQLAQMAEQRQQQLQSGLGHLEESQIEQLRRIETRSYEDGMYSTEAAEDDDSSSSSDEELAHHGSKRASVSST